jgi:hypothetical protein
MHSTSYTGPIRCNCKLYMKVSRVRGVLASTILINLAKRSPIRCEYVPRPRSVGIPARSQQCDLICPATIANTGLLEIACRRTVVCNFKGKGKSFEISGQERIPQHPNHCLEVGAIFANIDK